MFAPAFKEIPPQYTPGLSVSVFFEEKLRAVHPEYESKLALVYGSFAGLTPVLVPLTVDIAEAPEIPPTTLTDKADKMAPPFMLRAEGLLELSIRLLSATVVEPLRAVAPLAVGSRLST